MSTVRLDTAGDIATFLKILAEESVQQAKESLQNDPYQETLSKKMQSDMKVYGDITEQPEEEEDVDIDVEEEEVESAAADAQPSSPEEDLEVSLDSISDSINQLRSGRSVEDSQIKTQMRAYFDRLDETERQVLLVFLRAFSGILTGGASGGDAQDPSEPPFNITMSHEEKKEKEQQAREPEVEDVEDVEEEDVEEEEDTSPPIRVGKKQSVAEIRKRVRELMVS